MWLYPLFERIYEEIPVDPHSGFWFYHEKEDPNGDPLDLLLRADDGDEVALDMVGIEYHKPPRDY